MNILVFGKDGQLGKAFKVILDADSCRQQHCIHYDGRAECNLASSQAVKTILDQLKPDLIINAAAYTAVDKAETEIDLAFAVNATAPEIMAQYAVANNATLLHYSTDYVFDGSKSTPYVETDARNPLGIYGKSKAAGEVAIEKAFTNLSPDTKAQFAILRTSWLYGDGGNFIRTILRLANEREELKIIADQHGVPTSAEWLAGVSFGLVLNSEGQLKPFPSGIYHAVPSGETTWYGLAYLAVQSAIEAGSTLKTKPESIKPILAVEYPLPAPRPMNSRMANAKLNRALAKQGTNTYSNYNKNNFISDFPEWDSMVREYARKLAEAKMI